MGGVNMESAKLYCDESGTTGTNWTDTEQPYLVYGGWLILDQNKERVVRGIQEIFVTYQGTELKAKRLLKMGKATQYFKRLFDFMLTNKCLPMFIITNKLYITSAKLVETFFDNAYNTALSSKMGCDFTLKKQLAEAICKDYVINDFSKLIKKGGITLSEMVDIKEHLAEVFSSTKYLKHNISNLNNCELEKMISEFITPNTSRSLTIPTLNQLMHLLQRFAGKLDLSIEIIHDNIRGYDDWIAEIKNIYLSGKEPDILFTDSFECYSSMPNISEITFVDSKDSVLVQISDLLCGFIASCFKKIEKGSCLDENEKQVLKDLFVLHDECFCWDFVLSDALIAKYLQYLGFTSIQESPVNFSEIDELFAKHIK